jgi:glycosyltransferase involved in cell wall biosynthesis
MQPAITVVMPVRNEGRFIEASLGAVLAQDYPADRLEVIVADGMSTDDTRDAVARVAAAHPRIRVRILDNPGRIVPTGLNAAIAEARGDIIVRVDGHTIIAPDYVRRCVDALARTRADAVGGRMDPTGEGPFGTAVACATSSRFGVGGARFHYATRAGWVDTVYLGAWPRTVFTRIGGFDERLVRNQDDEFSYRIRANGGRILLDPSIRSMYFNRSTVRTLWRQYFQYGYWKVAVLRRHPMQMQPRQFAPPAFVMGLAATGVVAPFSSLAAAAFVGMAGSYAAVTLASSMVAAVRAGARAALLLPVAFATLHFAYGSGFLAGLATYRSHQEFRTT